MNGKLLSAQLSFLPEDMVAEAMETCTQLRLTHIGIRILRIAACLAVIIGLLLGVPLPNANKPGIITGQGLLSVTVYAADQSSSTTLSPDTVLPHSYDWLFVNWAAGLPITLSVSDDTYTPEDITFQVSVDGGGFYIGKNGGTNIHPGVFHQLPAQFTVPNNTTIFWSQFYNANDVDFLAGSITAYADIVIYNEEEIIGYAVIRFERANKHSLVFTVSLIESIAFSTEDGYITDEYVRWLIDEAKK